MRMIRLDVGAIRLDVRRDTLYVRLDTRDAVAPEQLSSFAGDGLDHVNP